MGIKSHLKTATTPVHAFRVGRQDAMYIPNSQLYIENSHIYQMIQLYSSSSTARSLLAGLASAFCHTWRAASWSRPGKRMPNTSEYQPTGWPSMPSLMFYAKSQFVCHVS